MASKKRKRILRFEGKGKKVSTDSKLRSIWERYGRDTQVVRVHLMRLESEGVKVTDLI